MGAFAVWGRRCSCVHCVWVWNAYCLCHLFKLRQNSTQVEVQECCMEGKRRQRGLMLMVLCMVIWLWFTICQPVTALPVLSHYQSLWTLGVNINEAHGRKKTLQRLFPKYVFFFRVRGFFHLFCSPLKPFFVLHPSNEVFLPRLQSGEVQGDFFLRTSFDKVGSKTALQEYSALIKTDLVSFTTKQIPNINQK